MSDGGSGIEISVVIPVHNSASILPTLHERLITSLEALGQPWEIVFVDDGSRDQSWVVLEELSETKKVRSIQMMKNVGQQRAILAGLAETCGNYVVTMDDDLQHRPEEIATLYEAIREADLDVVIGRYEQKKHGRLRGAGTALVARFAGYAVGVPPGLALTSFRIIDRRVVDALASMQPYSPVVGYMLVALTDRVANASVSHDPRFSGSSGYGVRSLVRYFRSMVIDYSDLPLRAVGAVGIATSLLSAALAAFYFVRYLQGSVGAPGFVTIVMLVLFFSGLILVSVGVIGSYLVRLIRSGATDAQWHIRRSAPEE